MKTAQQILRHYEEGRTTATGLILEILDQTDPQVISEALAGLPSDVFEQLREFVGYYTPSTRVFRGPQPRMQTVQFVKDWLGRQNGAERKAPVTAKDPIP